MANDEDFKIPKIPGLGCLAIFSVGSLVASFVSISDMSDLRATNLNYREGLEQLMDFNGCSDEWTSVPAEIVESDRVSWPARAITVVMTVVVIAVIVRILAAVVVLYTD